MSKVKILDWTTKDPLNMIGTCAGVCWNAKIDDVKKNQARALDCIRSNHGRTLEYPDVYMVLEGWSARAMRELYTHIIGTSRLQESTRYVNYKNGIEYVTPFKIHENSEAEKLYDEYMKTAGNVYNALIEKGIAKEDAAMVLPLAQTSKVVLKINARALIHFYELRSCGRAYWEIRSLAKMMKDVLSRYSEEWKIFCDESLKTKCDKSGYCEESHGCGRRRSKDFNINQVLENKI